MVNPALDFIQAANQGAAIGNMLRRAALEREAVQREEMRQRRTNAMRDVELEVRMRSAGGRPVGPGGTIADRMLSGDVPGMVGDTPFEVLRKPRAGQVVKWKTSGGEDRAFELPTEDEQIARQESALARKFGMERDAAKERMRDKAEFDAAEAERSGVAVPAELGLAELTGRKVPITTLDELYRAVAMRENIRSMIDQRRAAPEDPVRSVQMLTDDAGNVTPVTVRNSGKVERGATLGAVGKKARPVAARGGGREATPGQIAVQERATQRRIDGVQAQHDKAHREEQTLHAEATALGQRLKAVTAELESANGKQKDALLAERQKISARLPQAQQQAKAKNAEKQELLARKEQMRGGGGAPSGGPKVGEVREHAGAKYRFDGKQWVKQ